MISKSVFFTGKRKAEVREIIIEDPKSNEVQAKTLINGICMFDVWHYNNSDHVEPMLPGHEGLGIVTKVGSDITDIKEGDLITTFKWSEYTNQKDGTYIKISGHPDDLESYLVEPTSCAINATSYVGAYPGDRAIVFGAGYMGLLLIQVLSRYPLSELIVVDIKDLNLSIAKQYGATDVVNLLSEEGKNRLKEISNLPFDVSYECSGTQEAFDLCTDLTRIGGKIGLYAWHHGTRIIDSDSWHMKGIHLLNVSPFITVDDRPLRSFKAADTLLRTGIVRQEKLVTHKYTVDEVYKAMEESTLRGSGFIKSVFIFK